MKYQCPKCKNMSLIRREYHRKIDGIFKKIDWCYTKGCKYTYDYTPSMSIKEAKAFKEEKQGQNVFNFSGR